MGGGGGGPQSTLCHYIVHNEYNACNFTNNKTPTK